MSLLTAFLTFFLVINCLLLILLVLIQLPKKDAGAGMAFGAGAADALFGAGSGNALTKITKYSAIALGVLCLLINYIGSKSGHDNSGAEFMKQVQQKQMQSTAPTTTPASLNAAPAPAPVAVPAAASTNGK